MKKFYCLTDGKCIVFLAALLITINVIADTSSSSLQNQTLWLQQQPGFFRFSFDNVTMPNHIQKMGLLSLNYFADLTPSVYGGVGAYGSVTGTQGGLFILGVGGGVHHQLLDHWWGDVGLYVGGGGGRSSLVGGGLMLRPNIGIAYDLQWARLGLDYSYINFPSGEIRSQQIGLNLDLPYDFYYIHSQEVGTSLFKLDDIHLFNGKYLHFQRNDFAILLQAYHQPAGTRNVDGVAQDGTIGLVGAELDHYVTDNGFWWIKAGGAFSGIPNGYMDILGGFGYHWVLVSQGLALVPQLGAGAGGGGNVDTGGGILLQPQLGVEWPLTDSFAARLSGGYLWAPKGELRAYIATAAIIYHLNITTANNKPEPITNVFNHLRTQGWRAQLLNQTYLHPQRTHTSTTSAINLMAVQIDQFITPHFFVSYQAASAYSGNHAGGFATGLIGLGIQTPTFFHERMQIFTEGLLGSGGGGGLALGGGSLIEPVLGLHYALTQSVGLQTSISQIKALHHDLNTTAFNLGLTISFGTLA